MRKKNNMVYTYWEPPRNKKKTMGQFILASENNCLVYVELKDYEGKSIAEVFLWELYKDRW